MLKGILIILSAFFYISVGAQTDSIQSVNHDDASIVVTVPPQSIDFRIPEKSRIEKFQNDSRFDYTRVEKGPSLWDEIKYRIARFISELLGTAVDSGMPGIFMIIFIVAIATFIILKLLGINFKSILGKKSLDKPEIDIYTENVHEMDFDTLIANAMSNKDYRLAIRYMYLKNLKLLSDKQLIDWNTHKTNYSYQYEINSSSLRSKFLDATLIFDYIWYGEFPLDEQQFSVASNRMQDFNKMIADER